jgi:ABC-type multidrug transport system fused ATPase/permease subunit
MRDKIIDFIDNTLKTRVTPLSFPVTLYSLIWGFAFVFFGWETSVQSSLLFKLGALIGVPAWGGIVLIGAAALMYGLIKRHVWSVSAGSILLFMAWIFAMIIYLLNSLWFQAVISLTLVLMYGYFNIAAHMDRLWDYTPHFEDNG